MCVYYLLKMRGDNENVIKTAIVISIVVVECQVDRAIIEKVTSCNRVPFFETM